MNPGAGVRWGYAGPWYAEILPDGFDPLEQKVAFTCAHGLQVLSVALDDLRQRSSDQLAALTERLGAAGIVVSPYVTPDYLRTDARDLERETADVGDFLARHPRLFAGSIVKTVARAGHRFERQEPLETRLGRLAEALHRWRGPAGSGRCRWGSRITVTSIAATW